MRDFFTDKAEQLMAWVVPDIDACRQLAFEVRTRDPNARPEDLAKALIRYTQKQGATVGGLTGLASSPVTAVPAALADIAAMLKLEGTMAGGIAALLEPESLDDPEQFRADVLAIAFPAAFSQALRQLGIRAGEQLTRRLVRKAVGQGSLSAIFRVASRVLGARLTGRSLARGVPLVGAGIGAGWNWMEVEGVGRRAIAYYTDQPIGVGRLRTLSQKILPKRFRSANQNLDESTP